MEESDLRITVGAPDGEGGRRTVISDDGIKYCETRGHLIILHGGIVFIYDYSLRDKMATHSGELGEIVVHPIKMFVTRGDDIAAYLKEQTIGIAVSRQEDESITVFNYKLATNDISSTNKYMIIKGTDEPLPCPLKFNHDGTILLYFTKKGFQMMGSTKFLTGFIGEEDIPHSKSIITSSIESVVGVVSRGMIYKSVRGDEDEFIILAGEDGRIASYTINMANLQASPISVSRASSEILESIFSSDHTAKKGGIEFIEDLNSDNLHPLGDIDINSDILSYSRTRRQNTRTSTSRYVVIWIAMILIIIGIFVILFALGMKNLAIDLAKFLVIYFIVCFIMIAFVRS